MAATRLIFLPTVFFKWLVNGFLLNVLLDWWNMEHMKNVNDLYIWDNLGFVSFHSHLLVLFICL